MTLELRPQPGPQEMAAKSKARILGYGGGAGGGKSWFVAYRAAKYVNVPHYNACIFRRTYTMLEGSGSIVDETKTFYREIGGTLTQRPLEWTWPSPSRVEFRHLQHDNSAEAHKSKQYAFEAFDEASDFTGGQFFFMNSRLRTMSGVPKQFLLATNPDPDCYLRILFDWWIGSDGFPDPHRAGKLRFFVRLKDELVWADSPDPLLKYVGNDPNSVMSMTFVPALVHDNKVLLEADPGYMANLKSLPAVEQARFLGGNWDVKESAGDYFQRSTFKIWGGTDLQRRLMSQDGPAAKIVQSIRVHDFASTPIKGCLVPDGPDLIRPGDFKARDPATDNPDWSCSVLLHRLANGRLVIGDVTFYRDTPGAVQTLAERLAIADGPKVTIGVFADPGQAGEDQAERLKRRLQKFANVAVLSVKNKEMVARECARAVWRGEVYYVEAPWNQQFFNQLEDFPTPKMKDDAVVALANAYNWMLENPAPRFAYENPEETIRNEIWLPPNVNKADLLAPRRDNKRHATVIRSGSALGWRKLW
jgi:predicted phage terminase large subunit-like protein